MILTLFIGLPGFANNLLCQDVFPSDQQLIREAQVARSESIRDKKLMGATEFTEFHNFLRQAPEKLRKRIKDLQKEKLNPNSVYTYSMVSVDVENAIDQISKNIESLAREIEDAIAKPGISESNMNSLQTRISFAQSYLSSKDLTIAAIQKLIDRDAAIDAELYPKHVKLWTARQFKTFYNKNNKGIVTELMRIFRALARPPFIPLSPFVTRFSTWQITTSETTAKLMARGMALTANPETLVDFENELNRLPFEYVEHDLGHRNVFHEALAKIILEFYSIDLEKALLEQNGIFTQKQKRIYLHVLSHLERFIAFGESRFYGEKLTLFFDIATIFFNEGYLLNFYRPSLTILPQAHKVDGVFLLLNGRPLSSEEYKMVEYILAVIKSEFKPFDPTIRE